MYICPPLPLPRLGSQQPLSTDTFAPQILDIHCTSSECSRDLGVLPRHVLLRDEWSYAGDRRETDVLGAGGGGHGAPPL